MLQKVGNGHKWVGISAAQLWFKEGKTIHHLLIRGFLQFQFNINQSVASSKEGHGDSRFASHLRVGTPGDRSLSMCLARAKGDPHSLPIFSLFAGLTLLGCFDRSPGPVSPGGLREGGGGQPAPLDGTFQPPTCTWGVCITFVALPGWNFRPFPVFFFWAPTSYCQYTGSPNPMFAYILYIYICRIYMYGAEHPLGLGGIRSPVCPPAPAAPPSACCSWPTRASRCCSPPCPSTPTTSSGTGSGGKAWCGGPARPLQCPPSLDPGQPIRDGVLFFFGQGPANVGLGVDRVKYFKLKSVFLVFSARNLIIRNQNFLSRCRPFFQPFCLCILY